MTSSALDERLTPEQAHAVLRQRLEQFSPDWALARADVPHLARLLRCRTFDAGETILQRRVRADCLGLVVSGRVAVWREAQGAQPPDAVLGPGSVYGRGMLVHGQPNSATLEAATACEVWFLRRADLETVLTGRQARQRRTRVLRLTPWLAACLVAALLLALPPVRQVAALGPMAVGQWCLRRERGGCAERAWMVAARLAPSDAGPQLALGTLYFEQGDIAAAERALNAALELAPDSPEAYNNLGLIYARQGDYERAISAFEQALDIEPGSPTVEHNLAFSLQATGAVGLALEHYQLAIALGDQDAGTRANMAIAYLDLGQMAEAADLAGQALSYDDALAPAHTVLGAVALTSDDAAQAVPHLERAIALDAGYSPAYFYLGLAYKVLGQADQAIAAFEQALATAPDEAMRVQIRRHIAELNSPSP